MSKSRGVPLGLSRSDVDRWWTRIAMTDACAVWMGGIGSDGYGRFTYLDHGKERTVTPHQVAAELAHGPLNEGATILHDCDVRLCCGAWRAGHVRVSTQGENMQQAARRGRARGPRPGLVDVRGPAGQGRAIQTALRASTDRSPAALALVLSAVLADGDPLRDQGALFDLDGLAGDGLGVDGAGVVS